MFSICILCWRMLLVNEPNMGWGINMHIPRKKWRGILQLLKTSKQLSCFDCFDYFCSLQLVSKDLILETPLATAPWPAGCAILALVGESAYHGPRHMCVSLVSPGQKVDPDSQWVLDFAQFVTKNNDIRSFDIHLEKTRANFSVFEISRGCIGTLPACWGHQYGLLAVGWISGAASWARQLHSGHPRGWKIYNLAR